MRFMILVKATKNSEAGVLPDEKLLTAMGKYNEELAKAGVLLAAEGLQQLEGRPRQVVWRKADRDQRAFPRDDGTSRWLLDDSGEVKGRSDRLGEALP